MSAPRFVMSAFVLLAACAQQRDPGGSPPPVDQTSPPSQSERVGTDSLLVDLNSATKAQLIALPGVDEVYAQRIIDGRPYANKTQLLSRGIVPEGTYEKLRESVIARRP
jgi:competence protein ComEA